MSDQPDEPAGEARRRTPPRLRHTLVLDGPILRDTLTGLTPADLLALLPDPVANT